MAYSSADINSAVGAVPGIRASRAPEKGNAAPAALAAYNGRTVSFGRL